MVGSITLKRYNRLARLTIALIHGMLKNAVYTVVPEAIKSWPLREKRAVRGDALPT